MENNLPQAMETEQLFSSFVQNLGGATPDALGEAVREGHVSGIST